MNTIKDELKRTNTLIEDVVGEIKNRNEIQLKILNTLQGQQQSQERETQAQSYVGLLNNL